MCPMDPDLIKNRAGFAMFYYLIYEGTRLRRVLLRFVLKIGNNLTL